MYRIAAYRANYNFAIIGTPFAQLRVPERSSAHPLMEFIRRFSALARRFRLSPPSNILILRDVKLPVSYWYQRAGFRALRTITRAHCVHVCING